MITMTGSISRRIAPRCRHTPPCPDATQPDALSAAIIAAHPEQGWHLLCNGVITFDDTGALVGGRAVQPRRSAPCPARRLGARSSGAAA